MTRGRTLGKILRVVIICLIVGAVLGVSPAMVNATFTAQTDTPHIDFTLGPGGSISGVVTDGSNAIEGASVFADGNSSGSGTTGADGSYTIANLAPGNYEVSVEASGYAPEYWTDVYDSSSATPVSVTDLTDTSGTNFTLGPGGSISGVVTDGSEPIVGALVSADGNSSGSGATGADGTYTIDNLAPGSYTVQVYATGYAWEYYNNVYEEPSVPNVTVTDLTDTSGTNFTLGPGGSISGVVTDGSEPIEGASVWAIGNSSGFGTTGADGTYTIANLAPGDYVVSAMASGYVTEYWNNFYDWSSATPVSVTDLTDTSDTNFTLGPGGSISGVVTDGSDPIVGASVFAIGNSWGSGTTIAGGTYTIDNLAPGSYWVGAEASGYATEYWIDVYDWSSATPVVVVVGSSDSTPPTTPLVTDDGATTASTSQLHASWSSSDAESGIAEYQYAIGTTSGGTNIADWTSAGTNTGVTKTGISLSVGTTYYFGVKAKNGADLWSGVGVSDGIAVVVDTTAPTTPVVTDDGATTTSTSQLHASWSSSDTESGIAEYQYAIGTTSGGTNIADWTSVGTNTGVTKTGLSLSVGTTYYFGVKAKNGADLWSGVGVSDGIAVVADTTAPTSPLVTTNDASSITASSARLNGNLTTLGTASSVTVSFVWGTSSGSYPNETTGQVVTGTGAFYFDLSSLSAGTPYYYKSKAVGHGDAVYGVEKSFTVGQNPVVNNVNPDSGKRKQHLTVTITGANFDGATSVSFGAGITIEHFSVNSSTEVTAEIVIGSDAVKGARDASVTTGQGTGTKTGGFSVIGGGGGVCSGGASVTPGAPSEMTTTLAALGLLFGMGYWLVRRGTRRIVRA